MTSFCKKFLVALLVLVATAFSVSSLTSTPVFADTTGDDGGVISHCEPLLGLIPWDCNVNIDAIDSEDKLKSEIWLIVANIATDLTVIAAYLILGYVIYGGYLYIFSRGEPQKVMTGKKALSQAFIGLAIVMSANIIMSTLRIVLLGGSGKFGDCINSTCVDPTTMVESVIQWAIGIAGVVAAIFVVYGSVLLIASSGDPGKVHGARQIITYALIGLVIVAIAEIITAFVATTIRNANKSATSTITDTYVAANFTSPSQFTPTLHQKQHLVKLTSKGVS